MTKKKVIQSNIKPSEKTNGNYPFEFKAPSYDNRTSSSMKAGDYYGVGFRTPVGKEKAGSIESGPIPQNSYCFSPDDVIYGEDSSG